jgi:hypothetical protein
MVVQEFTLKRSIKPYIGELLIIIIITIGLIYTSIIRSTLAPLELAFVGLLLTVATHYADFRYRIVWRNGEIERVATNNSITSIKASDISRVVLEESNPAAMLALTRPMRRIAIYGKERERLDVSLKHFVPADIRQLMRVIHEQRPDLALPREWL